MHFRAITVFAAAFNGFTVLLDKAGAGDAVVNIDRAVVDDMAVAAQLAEGIRVAGVDINLAVVLNHRIGFGV